MPPLHDISIWLLTLSGSSGYHLVSQFHELRLVHLSQFIEASLGQILELGH